jgi:coenzyme F420-reducing hydrogenase gamma subunit
MSKPKVGVYGLTSCAGDQLAILNLEDELLELAGAVDIIDFPMAVSGNDQKTPLDIAFVEGSVVNSHDVEYLKRIRERASLLVAIGTCAVWGGVPAAANEIPREKLKQQVYGAEGKDFDSIPAQPLCSFVKVDYNIPGCPMEKGHFLKAVASLLHGDLPLLPTYAVCTECKMKENICLLQERNHLCLGPITVAGCEALCPSHSVPCQGCRGPLEEANVASEVSLFREKGYTIEDIRKRIRAFAAPAEVIQSIIGKE